jgi:hypothetical protein
MEGSGNMKMISSSVVSNVFHQQGYISAILSGAMLCPPMGGTTGTPNSSMSRKKKFVLSSDFMHPNHSLIQNKTELLSSPSISVQKPSFVKKSTKGSP